LSYHLALMYVHRFPIQCWRPFRPSRTNFMNSPSVNMLKCITKLRIIYRQAKVGRFRWFTTFPTRLAQMHVRNFYWNKGLQWGWTFGNQQSSATVQRTRCFGHRSSCQIRFNSCRTLFAYMHLNMEVISDA
jgi:hypothetical protein